MVGFDHIAGLAVSALHNVRVNGTLGDIFDFSHELSGFIAEDLGENGTDHFAFGFRIGFSHQLQEEGVPGIDPGKVQVKIAVGAEDGFDFIPFIFPHQAVIHKDAVQLGSDRSGKQGGSYRRVHTAGQAQNDMVFADLLPQLPDGGLREGSHFPVAPAAAYIQDKMPQHLHALFRMGHFRMELGRVEFPVRVFHGSHRADRRMGSNGKAFRYGRDIISMAHPDPGRVSDICKQGGFLTVDGHDGMAVFTGGGCLDCAAQLVSHQLGSVTDAQHRNAGFEKVRRISRGLGIINTVGTTCQNNAPGTHGKKPVQAGRIGMDLAIHLAFADPAGDQLFILSAEIQYNNQISFHLSPSSVFHG